MRKVLGIDDGCDDPLEIPIIVEDGPAHREKRIVVDARDFNAIKVEPDASPLLLFREIQSIGDVDHWRGKQARVVDGLIVNNSRLFPPPVVNIPDRLYFSEQKKWRGVGLYLDRIEISRVDHEPFFAMSRPVLDNDGNFQGIVAALIDPQYFAHLYDPHGEEASEFALLERDDGAALAGAGLSEQALIDPNHYPIRNVDQKNVSISEVNGFPAKIVLIGKPIIVSPQFATLVAMDLGLLIIMTVIALYLATRAARQAAAVDREAQARRTAEARLLSAIESAPAGFALHDEDDRLVLSNDLYTGLKDGQEFLQWRTERHRRGIGEPILQLR